MLAVDNIKQKGGTRKSNFVSTLERYAEPFSVRFRDFFTFIFTLLFLLFSDLLLHIDIHLFQSHD